MKRWAKTILQHLFVQNDDRIFMLIVNETDHPDLLVIHLSGKLDFTNAEDVENSIKELINTGGKNLIINLREVSFISSSGIRVLLISVKLAESLGLKVVYTEIQEKARYLLEILGLQDQIKIAGSYDEAVKMITG